MVQCITPAKVDLPYRVNGTDSPVENIIVNNRPPWHCITGSVILASQTVTLGVIWVNQ